MMIEAYEVEIFFGIFLLAIVVAGFLSCEVDYVSKSLEGDERIAGWVVPILAVPFWLLLIEFLHRPDDVLDLVVEGLVEGDHTLILVVIWWFPITWFIGSMFLAAAMHIVVLRQKRRDSG